MKTYFFTGLALLLPVVITLWLTLFCLNLLTQPFYNSAVLLLEDTGLWGSQSFITPAIVKFFVRCVILLALIAVVFAIGMLASNIIGHKLFAISDSLLHKIPLLNKIYKACKEVVHSVFDSTNQSFSQVVIVPFPHTDSYSIGFLSARKENSSEDSAKVSVFVPATPNPTMGFVLIFDREQVIAIDMKVDQALKLIVSCGAIADNMPRQNVQELKVAKDEPA